MISERQAKDNPKQKKKKKKRQARPSLRKCLPRLVLRVSFLDLLLTNSPRTNDLIHWPSDSQLWKESDSPGKAMHSLISFYGNLLISCWASRLLTGCDVKSQQPSIRIWRWRGVSWVTVPYMIGQMETVYFQVHKNCASLHLNLETSVFLKTFWF